MTPPPTPTPSAQASPCPSRHQTWHSTSQSLPTIIILSPSLIMAKILCVYPSSSGQFTWSIDSVNSASTVHTLPFEAPPIHNPFDTHSFKPRFKFPRSRKSIASSPFKPMDTFHVMGDHGFQVPHSVILQVHGSRRDSQGHTLYSVDISHPSSMEFRVIVPHEIYCRQSRNGFLAYCRQMWQQFRDFIGW